MTARRVVSSDYRTYLALADLLAAQHPRSDEHDEMLFIIAHQVHELWFKLVLHELASLQAHLAQDEAQLALDALRRTVHVFRAVVGSTGVFETLTPQQFARFRRLLEGSGSQSTQFHRIEAILGRRDARIFEYFRVDDDENARLNAEMYHPSVLDSLVVFLAAAGYPVPRELTDRDVTEPFPPSQGLREALSEVYADGGLPARICDGLVELDKTLQEWRSRHVSLVARIIGTSPGTGGSSGVTYLRATVSRRIFPDLWAARDELGRRRAG